MCWGVKHGDSFSTVEPSSQRGILILQCIGRCLVDFVVHYHANDFCATCRSKVATDTHIVSRLLVLAYYRRI